MRTRGLLRPPRAGKAFPKARWFFWTSKRAEDFPMATTRICGRGRSLWRKRNYDREFIVQELQWVRGKARRLFPRMTFERTSGWLTLCTGFITMRARLRPGAIVRKIRLRLPGVALHMQASGSMCGRHERRRLRSIAGVMRLTGIATHRGMRGTGGFWMRTWRRRRTRPLRDELLKRLGCGGI